MKFSDFYSLSLRYLKKKYSGRVEYDLYGPISIIFEKIDVLGGEPVSVIVYTTHSNRSGREIQIEWQGIHVDTNGTIYLPHVHSGPLRPPPIKPTKVRWFFRYLERLSPYFGRFADPFLHMANNYEQEYNARLHARNTSG